MNSQDKNNSMISPVSKAVNIKAEKNIRLSLQKEQQQFEYFMEHTPLLAWINDEDGILYYMNSAILISQEFLLKNFAMNW